MSNHNRGNNNGNNNSKKIDIYPIHATVKSLIKGGKVALVYCKRSKLNLEVPASLKHVEACMGENPRKVMFGHDGIGGNLKVGEHIIILARDTEPVDLLCWMTEAQSDACQELHDRTFRVTLDAGNKRPIEIGTGDVIDIAKAIAHDKSLLGNLQWEELIDGDFQKIDTDKVPTLPKVKLPIKSDTKVTPLRVLPPAEQSDSAAA